MEVEPATVSIRAVTRNRRASAENRSARRAAKASAERSRANSASIPRPQYLYGDAARLFLGGLGRMHLRNGRRRYRLAEMRKQFLERIAERGNDDRASFFRRESGQTILQAFERGGDVLAHDVGPRRQYLAEFDIGRAEAFERACKPLARPALRLAPAAERKAHQAQRERRAIQIFAWDQRVVTAERAGDAQQAPQIGEGSGAHIFQAECMAAMPPVRLRTFTRESPAASIILANFAWGGKRRMLSTR